ncbi:hypothetical protein AX17_003850 [Amanita inopinata Kibby_2008]|nr:hypothetical protein AX17_003850 [Amanita inopinata Kibby_2008]
MVVMNASHLMACTLLLLSLPTTVFARASRTALHGHGNVLDDLNPPITPFEIVYSALLIIFATISFMQLSHAAFVLFYKRTAEQDYRFRVPFILIMILTLLTSIIEFVLEAVNQYQVFFTQSNSTPGTIAVLTFMGDVGPILLYGGLLLLLAYRRRAQISPGTGQPVGFTAFGLVESVVVGVLLLFMLATTIAHTVIFGTPLDRITPDMFNLSANLYRPYLAASIVLTLLIGFDSISLWVKRDEDSSPRHLVLFDNNVLLPMAAVIWPLLMVSVLFNLATVVVLSLQITFATFRDITLAGLLIGGSTQVIVIAFALMFGFPVFKRNVGHVWEGKGPITA